MEMVICMLIVLFVILDICVFVNLFRYIRNFKDNSVGIPLSGMLYRVIPMVGISIIVGILGLVLQLL